MESVTLERDKAMNDLSKTASELQLEKNLVQRYRHLNEEVITLREKAKHAQSLEQETQALKLAVRRQTSIRLLHVPIIVPLYIGPEGERGKA